MAEGLASHKESASAAIADSLDGPGKALLLRALIASEQDKAEGLDSAYIDKLFKRSDITDPRGSLERYVPSSKDKQWLTEARLCWAPANGCAVLLRDEFEAALLADRAIRSGRRLEPPEQQNSVVSIALASSIPFIGMGFVDNAIMASPLLTLQSSRASWYTSLRGVLSGLAAAGRRWRD